jgi:hypothetical protein
MMDGRGRVVSTAFAMAVREPRGRVGIEKDPCGEAGDDLKRCPG